MLGPIVAAALFALWGLLMAKLFPMAWKLERTVAMKKRRQRIRQLHRTTEAGAVPGAS